MKKETEAVRLTIYIGESDQHEGRPLYKYLLELFRKEGLAGATVLRGIAGFGKSSHLHTVSILRLSADLPMLIEVVDKEAQIEKIKPKLDAVIQGGLVTEEKVKIWIYEGEKKA